MQYIVHRRFKSKCICGDVNLPYGTECDTNGNVIVLNNKPLVLTTSENAHLYFARNDDGNGLQRGKLTQEIMTTLRAWHDSKDKTENAKYDIAWQKIWADMSLYKFKRKEDKNYWLWNNDFFNAEISELEYILNLIMEQ